MAVMSIWLYPEVRVNIAYYKNRDSVNANSVIRFQSNGLMEVVIWKLKLTICLSNGIPL